MYKLYPATYRPYEWDLSGLLPAPVCTGAKNGPTAKAAAGGASGPGGSGGGGGCGAGADEIR